MALVLHRSLSIPLWAIAFITIALASPPRTIPPVTLLLGIAVLALTMTAMVQWRRAARLPVRVVPMTREAAHAGIIMTAVSLRTSVQTAEAATSAPVADDRLALVRMDDDGGWQVPREPALPIVIIPGAREPGMLTTFETSSPRAAIAGGPGAMAATTTAERQREGGGSPKYRRLQHS